MLMGLLGGSCRTLALPSGFSVRAQHGGGTAPHLGLAGSC